MSENEKQEVINEVIEAVKGIMWGWFESEYEYSSRCRDLENEIEKELQRVRDKKHQ